MKLGWQEEMFLGQLQSMVKRGELADRLGRLLPYLSDAEVRTVWEILEAERARRAEVLSGR